MRLAFTDFTVVTPLGAGRAATLKALQAGRSALRPCTLKAPFTAYAGEVDGLEDAPLAPEFARFDCRNNRLAALALRQDDFLATVAAARERLGPARIGVFAGTSTSGLLETESAYCNRDPATGHLPANFDYAGTHNMYALARFLRAYLGLAGPAFVVSTACAATSKIFASAARMIEAGLCDAALVGGADTLCATTLLGFHALGVMAAEPCRPFDAARQGISIGEAAGFVLLERLGPQHGADTLCLLGTGESSDAYHMSSPHPEGAGARQAMAQALHAAGLRPGEIDYINLHGTATLAGDAAEDHAVFGLFGDAVPGSSTKGFGGHALGASGVAEAVFCALAIQHGFLPGSPHTQTLDPGFRSQYVRHGRAQAIRRVLSNSFGFGGANCSLVLGRPS